MIKFEPQEEYTSSWDWTVKHSRYHFDNTRADQTGEWWTPLGRFIGNWEDDVARALAKQNRAITWGTRKDSPYYRTEDGGFEQSKMIVQEENDLRSTGAPVDLALTDVAEQADIGPTLTKIYEFFGLEDPWVRLHLQQPGQMFNLHIDKLWERCPEDPERICRIVVHLEDWKPGQFYSYGTQVLTHWRAGDAHTFDWPNVPHATANASRTVRPTMIMTGLKTERTRQVLASASGLSIYPV